MLHFPRALPVLVGHNQGIKRDCRFMKIIGLLTVLIGFLPAVALAQESPPEMIFSHKIEDFGQREFVKLKAKEGIVQFKASYHDSTYTSYQYQITYESEGSIIQVLRIDDPDTAEKHKTFYGLSGQIDNVPTGNYIFKIVRKDIELVSQNFEMSE